MLTAAFWGFLGASALLIGIEIAFRFRLRRMIIGLIMAFGIGTLISSIAFELVEASLDAADAWMVWLGLAAGAGAFFAGDRAIEHAGQQSPHPVPPAAASAAPEGTESLTGERSDPGKDDEAAGGSGTAIALGAALDGVPESAALGMSLAVGGSVSAPLLAAIWISNLPESLGSSVGMLQAGRSRGWIRRLWWRIALMSTVAAAVGYWIITISDVATGAFSQSFAAVHCSP